MCPQFKATNLDPGGFAEFVRVPAIHVANVAFGVPNGLTDCEASFMEPLGCCVRAVHRAGIKQSDVVVLVGLGSIGLLLLQLIRQAGAECVGIDLEQERRQLAERFGIPAAFSSSEKEFESYVSKATEERGADLLFLTAGNPAIVSQGLRWLRKGGTCLIFASLHPDSNVTLDWNELYYRELNIISSYSAAPADLKDALDLLGSGVVSVSELTHHTFGLEQFSEALRQIETRKIMKAIVTPNG